MVICNAQIRACTTDVAAPAGGTPQNPPKVEAAAAGQGAANTASSPGNPESTHTQTPSQSHADTEHDADHEHGDEKTPRDAAAAAEQQDTVTPLPAPAVPNQSGTHRKGGLLDLRYCRQCVRIAIPSLMLSDARVRFLLFGCACLVRRRFLSVFFCVTHSNSASIRVC